MRIDGQALSTVGHTKAALQQHLAPVPEIARIGLAGKDVLFPQWDVQRGYWASLTAHFRRDA